MQLQSFDAPRKLPSELGAGIAAGALLLGHGLAGMITGRPGRLLLQPLDGAEGSTVEVTIDGIQDLALLSKDVAVVLAGDHVLWALLDLHETTKVRQVAREVHALCARPHGESALALGIDGKATALTLSRNVVGVRTFALRGSLRACDVGEHVTYAVLSGDAGGQLRIHPGATPELGTSARVTLPEGAAGLDRVRGGQLLSAVYKRGEPTVCLVRGPGKLSAKLVQLSQRPVDVAVLDDHLLVAFVDGHLALYDGAVIADAGDAPMEPTSSIDLGAEGRPRVILAAQSKAGPVLWVGTSAGEALSVALREDPAPRVPTTIAPMSSPEASSPTPSAPAVTSVRSFADLEAELARLTDEHAREIAALKEANEQAIAALDEAHEQAIAALKEAHEQAHEQARAALEDAQLRLALGEEQSLARAAERDGLSAEISALARRLASAEAEVRARSEELTAKSIECDSRESEIETIEGQLGVLEEQLRGYEIELAARGVERDALFAEQSAIKLRSEAVEVQLTSAWAEREGIRGELASSRAEIGMAQSKLAAAEAEVRARTAELAAKIVECDERESAIDELESRFGLADEQLRGFEAEFARRTGERDALHSEAEELRAKLLTAEGQLQWLRDERTGWTISRDELTADLAAARGKVEVAEAQVRSREAELMARSGERDGLRAEVDRVNAELMARSGERDGLRAEVDRVSAELTARSGERDGLRAEVDRVNAELTARSGERDGLRAEVDRVNAELVTMRERTERAERSSLLGPDGRVTLERAKGTLDAVLSQAKSALFKRE